MRYLILLLSLITIPAYGNVTTDAGRHIQSDSDNNRQTEWRLTINTKGLPVRFQYSDFDYKSENQEFNSDRYALLYDTDLGGGHFSANIGINRFRDFQLVTGSVYYDKQQTESLAFSIGVEREIVNNAIGITDRISYTNTYAGIDYYRSIGIAASAGVLHFSDSNRRTFIRSKVYRTVGEGWHVYVRNHTYWNSDPFNGNYFSPDEYIQVLFGVGFRQRVFSGLLVGHADIGRNYISDFDTGAHTWRVSWQRDASWADISLYAASDYSNVGYRYRQIGITFSRKF